jgi:hypothetical protein
VDDLPTLGPLITVAVLRLNKVFIEAYSTGILHVWYHLIDMHFIVFRVQFEDGLSISVLKTEAHTHFISHSAFFNPSMHSIKTWGYPRKP